MQELWSKEPQLKLLPQHKSKQEGQIIPPEDPPEEVDEVELVEDVDEVDELPLDEPPKHSCTA